MSLGQCGTNKGNGERPTILSQVTRKPNFKTNFPALASRRRKGPGVCWGGPLWAP